MNTLLQELGITTRHRVISIVGSGGKTTLMYALARECANQGEVVMVTTTTHIKRPQEPDFLLADLQNVKLTAGKVTVVGEDTTNQKLKMPSADMLTQLCKSADRVLIEADGSKMLPIKFPNNTEPVILPCTDLVIAVAGLSALGKPLNEVCHRAGLAQDMLGIKPEQLVTPEILANLLIKGYKSWNPTVVLNQADDRVTRKVAEQTAALLRLSGFETIIITSLNRRL